MLYPTLPHFFQFNLSATSNQLSPSVPPLSPRLTQGCFKEEKMECREAFKTSFRPEMGFFDDAWGCGGGLAGGFGDDFFVDDLLDFSNEEVEGFIEEEKDYSVSSLEETGRSEITDENSNENSNSNSNCNSSVSVKSDLEAVPASELSIPADDIANLEWLSHFVDDSFSEFPSNSDSLPCVRDNREKNRSQTEKTTFLNNSGFGMKTRFPAKARSKRSRTGVGVWSFRGPLTESSSTTSSSSSCLIFSSSFRNPGVFYCFEKPPLKKQNKGKKSPENSQPQRRCSHCLVQKTPQWRAGPLGSKTLCNACGVRYKSGRLLPEYRPAGSPTFLSDIHSNNHRKVLEMRRKKEQCQLESGFPAVESC